MGDVSLSELIDPAAEARLRAAAGMAPSDDPPATVVESKADEFVDASSDTLEVKDESSAADSPLEHKSAPAGTQVLEADDQTGRVVALVSVTGVEDRVKDIIEPGAYTKTMAEREPIGVWSHDDKTWVARTESAVELMPGDPFFKGLKTMDGKPWPAEAGAVKVEAQFNLDTPHGKAAYSDVKFFQGKTGWSIGYRATKAHRNVRTGVRHIKELDWFEYSPVMVGAASQPMTLAVKSLAQPVDPNDPSGLVGDELVDTLSDEEVKAYFDLRESLGLEVKDRVRTAAGARRFGQPIGTEIVRDRVPASALQVGDMVDMDMPGPGGPSDPVHVKGNISAVSHDGNVTTITVNGAKHKLISDNPVEIRRAEGPGGDSGGGGGDLASEGAVRARLDAMKPGELVTVTTEQGNERHFAKDAQGGFVEANADGSPKGNAPRRVTPPDMARVLFTAHQRDGKNGLTVKFGGDAGGKKPDAKPDMAHMNDDLASLSRGELRRLGERLDGQTDQLSKDRLAGVRKEQERRGFSGDGGGSSKPEGRLAEKVGDETVDDLLTHAVDQLSGSDSGASSEVQSLVDDYRKDPSDENGRALADFLDKHDTDATTGKLADHLRGKPLKDVLADHPVGGDKAPASTVSRGGPDRGSDGAPRGLGKPKGRAADEAAHQRTKDREALAAYNRKRAAQGKPPVLKLPEPKQPKQPKQPAAAADHGAAGPGRTYPSEALDAPRQSDGAVKPTALGTQGKGTGLNQFSDMAAGLANDQLEGGIEVNRRMLEQGNVGEDSPVYHLMLAMQDELGVRKKLGVWDGELAKFQAYGGSGIDGAGRKSDDELEQKRSRASLNVSPRVNWVERAGELPGYIREVARAIHEDHGVPLSRAIPMAIGRIKKWAAGIGNVTAETRAKAAAAVAAWEALKAKSGKKFDSDLLAALETKTVAEMERVDGAWAVLEETGELKEFLDALGFDFSTAVEEPVDDGAGAAEVKADAPTDDGLVDITDLLARSDEIKSAVTS